MLSLFAKQTAPEKGVRGRISAFRQFMTDLLNAKPYDPIKLGDEFDRISRDYSAIALWLVQKVYWEMENEKLQLTFDF